MSDGTPPPDYVSIDLVCSGGTGRRESYTDSKGRFSFQVGQNSAASFSDASMSGRGGLGSEEFGGFRTGGPVGGSGERSLTGCELRATLAGFRADSVNLANHRSMDNPDVGIIYLRRLGNVEGLTVSVTSAMAPKDARKAYDKARELLKKEKSGEAEKDLRKAVEAYPKFAAAWFEIGRIQQQRSEMEAARKSYGEAISADGKFVSPYRQLAIMAAKEQKWPEVATTTDQVIRLNPVDFPDMYFYNAVAKYNLKDLDAAEKSAREAIKIDPEHRNPRSNHLLGVILAQKEDYTGAAENMKAYLQFAPNAPDAAMVQKQLAEMQKFLGDQSASATPAKAAEKN